MAFRIIKVTTEDDLPSDFQNGAEATAEDAYVSLGLSFRGIGFVVSVALVINSALR